MLFLIDLLPFVPEGVNLPLIVKVSLENKITHDSLM